MAYGRVYNGSDSSVSFQTEMLPSSSDFLHSLLILPRLSPSFQGSKSMANYENASGNDTTDKSCFKPIDKEKDEDCYRNHGKKRRLSEVQVQSLEKNFKAEHKLEPDRKVRLANELGLQPSQVAIWFQNRRARSKTKQLETDYVSLKDAYDKLKVDCDSLLKENEILKIEVKAVKDKMGMREIKEKDNLEALEDINATSMVELPQPYSTTVSTVCKQEDASLAKSDVFDSGSPHNTEKRSLIDAGPGEPAEQSDFSQEDEENSFSNSLLQSSFGNSSFLVEEDQPVCFWLY